MSDVDPTGLSSGWLVTFLVTALLGTLALIKGLGQWVIGRHIKRIDNIETTHRQDIVKLHERVDETHKIFMDEHDKTRNEMRESHKRINESLIKLLEEKKR